MPKPTIYKDQNGDEYFKCPECNKLIYIESTRCRYCDFLLDTSGNDLISEMYVSMMANS